MSVVLTVFFLIAFTFGLKWFMKWYLEYRRRSKLMEQFPGPWPLPFIGNILDFPSIRDIVYVAMKYLAKYGDVFRVKVGFHYILAVADYDLLEHILTSTKIITKPHHYTFFHRWLGLGLLTSTGEKWQKRRKLLTPAFHFKILEQFLHVFDSASDILIEKLSPEVGKSFDIHPYLNLCSLDIICESVMGIKINAQENTKSEYVLSVKEMGRILMDRSISVFNQSEFLYSFTEDYKKEKKYVKYLHDTTEEVIRKRREDLLKDKKQEEGEKMEEENIYGGKRKLAFLDLLLQASDDGVPLKDEDIREEVDTFMFEGHDTTTCALGFTLYLLSCHQDVQEKARKEVDSILQDKSKRTSYQDLQDMKYLEMVIKESLRLYPPVPIFGRVADQDFQFQGKLIPKGVTLGIAAGLIHRNPKNFVDPYSFDPERFSPEMQTEKKPFSYVPFSAGPRNCIGQKFAMLELKSVLSKILRHYILHPVYGYEPALSPESIMKSLNGILVRLEKR